MSTSWSVIHRSRTFWLAILVTLSSLGFLFCYLTHRDDARAAWILRHSKANVGHASTCLPCLWQVEMIEFSFSNLSEDEITTTLRTLPPLRSLRSISLSDTGISGKCLEEVARFSQLHRLSLFRNAVTDSSIVPIRRLRALKDLSLGDTSVTNQALHTVVELQSLRQLDISGTVIDDDGIDLILALPELESLGCRGSRITPVGLQRIRQSRPAMRIFN